MAEISRDEQDEAVLRHPLVRDLGRLTAELVGLRLLIIYPSRRGWKQIYGDTQAELNPRFCKLIQSSTDGSKHCRMCHILMSVAASSEGPIVQRCHAGARVLTCPVASASDAIAIMSSCTYGDPHAWEESAARGKALGLDHAKLKRAYEDLPKLDSRKQHLIEGLMLAMSRAVEVLRRGREIEARLDSLDRDRKSGADVSQFLKKTMWVRDVELPDAGKPVPRLIQVVCELVRQRPELPLTVKELAAAARMTPNHFTTLFGQQMGVSFSEYLATHRMERAKQCLDDLTRSVNEIARSVGYDDPGYFARRFRQKVGMTPREWRNRKPTRKPSPKLPPCKAGPAASPSA